VIANRMTDADQVADLTAWLQLVEMGADGATMLRVKRYTNPVPFMNQHLKLQKIAETNGNLVRRVRQAMRQMGLDDRVVWPEGSRTLRAGGLVGGHGQQLGGVGLAEFRVFQAR
jgi:hypothetical protein